MDNSRTVAIILAAGLSSRMGDFKPLLDIGGQPALIRLLDSITSAGIKTVCIVTGFKRELIEEAVSFCPHPIPFCLFNERFEEGMFGSVQAGLRFARERRAERALIFPVDTPLISADSVAAVLRASGDVPDSFAVCCYYGKKGHPLLIPMKYSGEILDYSGAGGLKAISDRYDDEGLLLRVETGDEGAMLDMDTPEGYAELLEYDAEQKGLKETSDGISALSDVPVRPVYLIRHGHIEQHEGKIFLGQTDVHLSEAGRADAAGAARELMRLGVQPKRIYSSDLSRALETANIIAGVLGVGTGIDPGTGLLRSLTLPRNDGAGPGPGAGTGTNPGTSGAAAPIRIIPLAGLRETNLGAWDGLLISEIKERYPVDYEKRGRDILGFKTGHDMENFYDMRYRVMKTLRREILPQHLPQHLPQYPHLPPHPQHLNPPDAAAEAPPDDPIVIVSHAGPIRAIMSVLTPVPDEEAWAREIAYGSVNRIDG
jgi:broad specificity phosphatase PhoE/CTP:molybdopterin cytidylyltransferase MocA